MKKTVISLLCFVALLTFKFAKGQGLELIYQKEDFKGFPADYNFSSYQLYPLPGGAYYFIQYSSTSMKGYLINPKAENPDLVTSPSEAERAKKGKDIKVSDADIFYGMQEQDLYYRTLAVTAGGTALWYYNPFRGTLTVAQPYKSIRPGSAYNYNYFGDFYEWYMINNTEWSVTDIGMKGFNVYASFDEMKLYSQFYNSPPINQAAILLGEGNLALNVEPLNITHRLVVSFDGDRVALLRGTKDFLEVAIATGFSLNGCCSTQKRQLSKFYVKGDFSASNRRNVNYNASFFDAEGNFWLNYSHHIFGQDPQSSSKYTLYNPIVNPYFPLKTIDRNEPEYLVALQEGRKKRANWMASMNKDGKVFLDVGIAHSISEDGVLILNFINILTNQIIRTEQTKLPLSIKNPERISIAPNPYDKEIFISVPREGFMVYSYENIFKQIVSDNPALLHEYDEFMSPISVKETVQLPNGGTLTGETKKGYRDGEWTYTKGDTTETWLYETGYRIDDQFKELMAPLKEKYDNQVKGLFSQNLKELYDAYQEKVKDRAAFSKAFNTAAGTYIGSKIGTDLFNMDGVTSVEFGMALTQDLSNGQVSNLNNFLQSYSTDGGITTSLADTNTQSSSKNASGSLAGTWVTTSGNISVAFNSSGSGQLVYKNIGGACGGDQVIDFNWTSTDKILTLDYTSMSICGEKTDTPKSDGAKSYTLEGNTLKWAGATWNR